MKTMKKPTPRKPRRKKPKADQKLLLEIRDLLRDIESNLGVLVMQSMNRPE